VATAFLEGVEMASKFMMTASGQFEAEMGEQGNEKSGKAINERQRQADRATYHFVDNQALAIRRQGQIILEWVPEIYDTKRILKIIGEDGEETHVQVDPMAEEAHQKTEEAAIAIFNPNVGRYEVVSDVGPDYATQRQEAFQAIVQILTQAPQLIDKIGDLLFKVADFPLADEIAERMKPGLPPEAQKAIGALQEQLQKQNKLLGETMQALSEERLKVKDKAGDVDVKVYDAETRRLSALKEALGLDPEVLKALIREAMMVAMKDTLTGVTRADAPDLSADLPGDTGFSPLREPSVDPGASLTQ
jgi:DNA-binding protein YbaB